MIQDVFGLSAELAAPFDFSFLKRYGKPICVFERPQTGCLLFETQSAQWGQLLVKFAGAPLVNSRMSPVDAAKALCLSMSAYQDLYAHPALIKLMGCGTVAGGYAAVFRRPEGISLDPGTQIPPADRYDLPASPLYQLSHQPLIVRLRMLDSIFDFHHYALRHGYMAVGFSESSLAADFTTGRISICDIDLYQRLPCYNTRGRMPGSPRFLAPEAYVTDAKLDGITLQYIMGALSYVFLSDRGIREKNSWTASSSLYQVASRACAENREDRYPSYDAFLAAWRQTVGSATVY